MKKIYALLTIFSFLSYTVSAQEILQLIPNTVEASGDPTDFSIKASTYGVNVSDETIEVMWDRDISEIPSGWQNAVCDAAGCYPPNVDSCPEDRPNVMMPGDTIEFYTEVRPQGITGQATVRIHFWEKGTEEDLNTLTADFRIGRVSTSEVFSSDAPYLFPNPSRIFQLSETTGVDRVSIRDIFGNEKQMISMAQQNTVNLSQLHQGVYFASIFSKEGSLLRTQKILVH